jgi:F-type H+-transporting ATPase subunit b
MKKAKEHSEVQAQIIIEEAQKNRDTILKEAAAEIERNKQSLIDEIRGEVTNLIVASTEKIINEKLDAEKDKQIINMYVEKLSKN